MFIEKIFITLAVLMFLIPAGVSLFKSIYGRGLYSDDYGYIFTGGCCVIVISEVVLLCTYIVLKLWT